MGDNDSASSVFSRRKLELLNLLLKKRAHAPGKPHDPIKRNHATRCPASFAQQRLYFIDQMFPGSALYNLPVALRVKGHFDFDTLQRCLNEVVRRHEVLRTTFTLSEGYPEQIIHPCLELTLGFTDLSSLPDCEREARARRESAAEARAPFDLSAGPLLRARLLRLAQDDHLLLLTMHHVVTDGWSLGVLARELRSLYPAFARGLPSPLSELPVQYADYALWQRERLTGEVLERELEYWKGQLAGAPPVLTLPTDRPRPAVQSYRGAREQLAVSAGLTASLRDLSRREGATLFMTLLAAFAALLSRHSRQKEMVIGTPIAGRTRAEVEGLIGFFVNTLALRVDLAGDPTFLELLGRVRDTSLGAYAHQEMPFERLVEELAPERSLSHAPFFQVMAALQNAPVEELRLPGLAVEPFEAESGAAKFDLMLAAWEEAGGWLRVTLEYAADLFERETVVRMLGRLRVLLEAVAEDPHRRLSELPLLSEEEREQVLRGWNDTREEYPAGKCLHQLFEEQVERTPEAIALVYEGEELTYAELNRRANQLAHHLRERGVGPESRVAVMLERSVELVVALLGVLKAGAAYVPIDPGHPAARVGFMLADSGASVLLTRGALAADLPAVTRERVLVCPLDAEWPAAGASRTGASGVVTPLNLAYVIYTSGSTGEPKGVMNTHAGITNRLQWMQDAYGLTESDRVLQKTPYTFDVSVWEFFWPLMTGACMVLARPGGHKDCAYLINLIIEQKISTIHFIPSMLRVLLEEEDISNCRSLKNVFCSGEALHPDLRDRFFEKSEAGLHNLYGPTEAAVDVTAMTCERRSRLHTVSIGRPIANTQIYILDDNLEPVPVGVVGELYVGGAGLARGYVGRPARTASAFLPDPFSKAPGSRLYRTGDLARRLADGQVEFAGRADRQAKVRGHRVEPGEVEAALRRCTGVREAAVVILASGSAEAQLVAYMVMRQEATLCAADVRRQLSERLPEYMIPSAFVPLGELPRTPTGKIDLKALPTPTNDSHEASGHRAPETRAERLVASLYRELLNVEAVSASDDFFKLGGHSLLAMRLVARLRVVARAEISIQKLFASPSVEALARCVEQAWGASPAREDEAVGVRASRTRGGDEVPLSRAQQPLWFFEQLHPASTLYKATVGVRLRGPLAVAALGRSVEEIKQRHEVLRTTYREVDGRPVALVSDDCRFVMPEIDLRGVPEAERHERAWHLAEEEARRPVDLAEGPLMRASVIRLGEEEHVLLFTVHHIIWDGWSMGVFIRELQALYAAHRRGGPREAAHPSLEATPLQYSDYVRWQEGLLRGEALERRVSYWRERLRGIPPVVSFKPAGERPAVLGSGGGVRQLELDASTTAGLRRLSLEEQVTLFMTLAGAFMLLLQHYSGLTDVVIGTALANRGRSEFEGVIGLFVNEVVLRTDLGGNPTFRELLGRVRRTTLEAYDNQDVPFPTLVSSLNPKRDLGRNPLFQVMFVLQPDRTTLELDGLQADLWYVNRHSSPFDCSIHILETPEGLRCSFRYNSDLFEPEAVELILTKYRALLSRVAADPAATLLALNEELAEVELRHREARAKELRDSLKRRLREIKRRTQ